MYQNQLDHSNHRMMYSFATNQIQQSPHRQYVQMIDPNNSRNFSSQKQFVHLVPSVPQSETRVQNIIKKDIKNIEQDYQKLFVGGELSNVSSNQRPTNLIQTKNVTLQNKYQEQITYLKQQYQKKIDMMEEQNEQNQRSITQQYSDYLNKLRSQNNQLISINKEYQSEIKELLKQMQTISLGDVNILRNENFRLKQTIKQLEQSKHLSKQSRSYESVNNAKSRQEINYLTNEIQKANKIIDLRENEIENLKHHNEGLKIQLGNVNNMGNQNSFIFQIQRYKQIVDQKNNQISNIKSISSSLERKISSMEQTINELSSYKEKFFQVSKQKQNLLEIQSQLRKTVNEKVNEIGSINSQKVHQQKKQEYLTTKLNTLQGRYRTLELQFKDIKTQLQNQKKKKKQKGHIKEYEQYISQMNQTIKEFKNKIIHSQKMQESQKQVYEKQQQLMDTKFNQLASILEWKEKQMSELSTNLNQSYSEVSKQLSKIKEYQEIISSLRQQLESKSLVSDTKRTQYEKNLIKYKSEAEISYNKNLEHFKQRISRLQLELSDRSPKRLRSQMHVRSPKKSRRTLNSNNNKQSSKSVSAAEEMRVQQFQERINEFLKHNRDQDVYQILEETKLQLRYLFSQNIQLQSFIKVLQTSKDLNNKSIIADDKIRFGQAKIQYINQKNAELQQRINILISINNELKQKVEQANIKIYQLNKRHTQIQQKLDKNQQIMRDTAEKSKQEYDKLFQLHTSTSNKIPLLQRTIGDLTRQIEDKKVLIRQINNKNQNQNNTLESKSSYFFNRIDSLNKDLEYAQQDIQQFKTKCWGLERDLKEAHSDIEALQNDIKSKQTQLSISLGKYSEVSIELNLKTQQLSDQKLEIVALKNTNELLNERLKVFTSEEQYSHQANTKEILTLHNQLEQSTLTLNLFKQHRQSNEQALRQAKAQIPKLNNEITQLKFKLETKQRQINENKTVVRMQSKNSSEGTRNSMLLQQKLTRANTEISSLTNKILALELQINKMKQNSNQLQGKLMITGQQLQSQCAQKNQLQLELNKVNEQVLTISRKSSNVFHRTQSNSKQIIELQRKLKIANEEKQGLMKQLKQYVTQTHNQTSEKHDRFNVFLKQQLQASQLQLQKVSQSISSQQALNEHYYTLLQEIPTRYSFYFNFMKKINLQFRDLVGQLDLPSNPNNTQISNKLLANISQSLQIFDQIRHLQDQVQMRIKQLQNLKNG